MILKILGGHGEWWMYDGLVKLHWWPFAERKVSMDTEGIVWIKGGDPSGKEEQVTPSVCVLCDQMDDAHLSKETDRRVMCFAIGRTRSGEEIYFVFDRAYLLNDKGDTLEVIS